MSVTDRKEIVYPPFYLLHHSMHTVGISAMFHSLQPTSASLGVGKHEQDYSVSSANTNWDGKFNCIKKKNVLFHSSLPQ